MMFSLLLVGACVGILAAPMYGLIQLRKLDHDQRVWTAEIDQRQRERARLETHVDEQQKSLRQVEVSLAGIKAELELFITERNGKQDELAALAAQLSTRQRQLADVESQVEAAEGRIAQAKVREQSLIATNNELETTNQRRGVDNADSERLRSDRAELAKALEIDKASVLRIAAEQSDATEQLATTRAELATTKLDLGTLQSKLKTFKEEAATSAGELRGSIAQLTLEKLDLAKSVGVLDARRLELAQELEAKTKELAMIQQQTVDAKRKLREATDKSQEAKSVPDDTPPQPPTDTDGTTDQ